MRSCFSLPTLPPATDPCPCSCYNTSVTLFCSSPFCSGEDDDKRVSEVADHQTLGDDKVHLWVSVGPEEKSEKTSETEI